MKTENKTLSDVKIQWHPAFYAAAELELAQNRNDLIFQKEYNLSKKPLQIDLLVIEKLDNVTIQNEIGHIFRRYNIVEYKSPDDSLTIDDFFKTTGYACIFKALGETVDQIPLSQLTISLFRENYPRKLFHSLKKYGFVIEKKYDGIYYVKNFFIPAQIIVTKELIKENHRCLRILSKKALEEDVRGFVEDAQKLTIQGDLENVDAILQASISANYKLYSNIKRGYPVMCEAMRRLFQEEIEAEMKEKEITIRKSMQSEIEAAEIKKAKEISFSLANMGLSIEKIAKATHVSVKVIQEWLSENNEATK